MASPEGQLRPPTQAQFRTAGFALAHALGSVEGGETLCTLAIVRRGEIIELVRYEAPTGPASVLGAHKDLSTRVGAGAHAALVYDGYATIDDVRRDAMIVELIGPDGTVQARLIQLYRPARFGRLPGLLRSRGAPLPGGVQVIGQPTAEGPLPEGASEALTRGLAEHPYGRKAYRLDRLEANDT